MSKKDRKERSKDESKPAAAGDIAPKEEMSGKDYSKALRKLCSAAR